MTEFAWMNPHSLIKFDYKTATGEAQHWTMEIGSPPSMALLGWSRTTLKAGDVITAFVYQSKTGVLVGRTQQGHPGRRHRAGGQGRFDAVPLRCGNHRSNQQSMARTQPPRWRCVVQRTSVSIRAAPPRPAAASTATASAAPTRCHRTSPPPRAVPQLAAVCEHDVIDATNGVLGLRLVDIDRDDIAGCHRRLGPPEQAKRRGTPSSAAQCSTSPLSSFASN